MTEQVYVSADYWKATEWPLALTLEQIEQLNEIAPHGYYYQLSCSDDGEGVYLMKYVGEADESELETVVA